MIRKLTVRIALAVAAAGTAGGVTALGLRRLAERRRPDECHDHHFEELQDSVHRSVATSDGGAIHVVDRGNGRPFVLLPGVTLTTVSWHYQLIDLADAGFRVVALDIRGHGQSSPGSDGYSVSRLADDVYEVLRALELRDAIIVGHSLGGMTALQLLVDHPEMGRDGTITGIVLVSTSASMVIGNGVPAVLARVAGLLTPAAGRGHLMASAQRHRKPAHRIASLYCRLAFGASPSPTHIELVRDMTSAVSSDVLSPLIVTLLTMDVRKLLSGISVPAMVVVGRRDLITPIWHSRYLASHIPGAELEVLPRCGHLVLFERRQELGDLLVGCAGRWPQDRPTTQAADGDPAGFPPLTPTTNREADPGPPHRP